jgi:hypothetical protein
MRLFIFVGVLLSLSPSALGADLASIQNALRELQTSITSIRIEYVVAYPSTTIETVFLQAGPKLCLSERSPDTGTRLRTFDGEFSFDVVPDPSEESQQDLLAFKDVAIPGHLVYAHTPLRWWGHSIGVDNKPLWELLESAVITGESTYNGWDVVDVDLGVVTRHRQATESLTCKLSKKHDFAPVLMTRTLRGSIPDNVVQQHSVETFREIFHPLLNRTVAFPDTMRFETVTVQVKSVEFNPSIPAARFTPEIGPNMKLHDRTKPVNVLEATLSDRPPPKAVPLSELVPVDNPIQAVPETPSVNTVTFLIIGIVVLIIAGLVWVRAGRA